MTMKGATLARYSLILIATTLLLISGTGCGIFNNGIDKNMMGEYAFRFPSGEIEVLVLHKDSTYEHTFYDGVASYRSNRDPQYRSVNQWEYNGERFYFRYWQDFCPSGNPISNVVPPLPQGGLLGPTWSPAKNDQPTHIVIDRDYDYIFVKVKDRNEVFK
ncbi:MAG: hypothetical protein WBO28_02200 [Flavobacteriales bacterium]|jgi:hypothetical protein